MMHLTYDIEKSYDYNYERGPVFPGQAPVLPEAMPGPDKLFLGKRVNSRLGIAAGLLLNSRWILGYAEWGYDLLTYKTVRSRFRPCYDPPNWVFVEDAREGDGAVRISSRPPADPAQATSAVCFGMPSMAPEVWREDVARAKRGLGIGKLLIVSVVASPDEGASAGDVARDFRQCAEWAAEAGADIVEANFSCPNVCSPEGSIYMDAELSRVVALEIRRGLGETPLLIKVGHVKGRKELRGLLRALDGVASGVTMVNGVTRRVWDGQGRPVFGPDFEKAGVVGASIHGESVAQVLKAKEIVQADGLGLELAAVGGAVGVGEIGHFFAAGAGVVLMGSSPMYHPGLAVAARRRHPEW